MPHLYGYPVPDEAAYATVRAVFSGPFNFMDTSNGYGDGNSERRIGHVVREQGGVPKGFVLATKVDADKETGDFSGDRVRRSAEESLKRLGVDRFPLLHFHDPEYHMTFSEAMRKGGPVDALVKLKEEGIADHLGIAAGPIPMLIDFVRTGLFAAVLSHNRYTLLDRSGVPLLDEAKKRNVAFINGAPYGGGILVKGPDAQPKYAYRPAHPAVVHAARAMGEACRMHGVPLSAAALQFSLRDPRVTSTVIGFTNPSRISETIRLGEHPIPQALWDELESLTPPAEVWLN
jgi:D-threo-aldose 1-dehydrogenase